jgi:hypothetical protein
MNFLPKTVVKTLGFVLLLTLATATVQAQRGRSWVNGIVFDESETQTIAGATVELTGDPSSPGTAAVKLSTKTDDGGKYYFKDVPRGDYTFKASAPGFAPYQINLFVASDSLTALQVKLRKAK